MSDRKLSNRDIKGRRGFLKHCFLLGSTPLLSAFNMPVSEEKSSSSNRTSRPPRTKIIGVGSFGIDAVRALSDHVPAEIELLGLDVEFKWGEEHRLTLFSDLRQPTEPNEWRWKVETFGQLLRGVDTVRDALTDTNQLIVACHSGSDNIRFTVPVILDLAHNRGADVRAILCQPFSFEGSTKERNFRGAVNCISPYSRRVHVIDTYIGPEYNGRPLKDVFTRQEQEMHRALLKMVLDQG